MIHRNFKQIFDYDKNEITEQRFEQLIEKRFQDEEL